MSLISKYSVALNFFAIVNPKYAVNNLLDEANTKSALLFLFNFFCFAQSGPPVFGKTRLLCVA